MEPDLRSTRPSGGVPTPLPSSSPAPASTSPDAHVPAAGAPEAPDRPRIGYFPELGDSPVRTIGKQTFDFSREIAVMAIINRTRDSFFDKGRTFAFDTALDAAQRLLDEGAHWLDIGGVPFSPISEEVTEEQELERIVPFVAAVRARTDAVISVDTFRAEVAREAMAAGADAINDTSGLHDPTLAEVAAETGATLVITHSKAPPRTWLSRPTYRDVLAEVGAFLRDRVRFAESRGVPPDKIVIDPGHDLNKNTYHSLELTRRLGELTGLGYPLLASVSNKDFIQETLDRPSTDVTDGTLATLVWCVMQGARILRVHDVRATTAAVHMAEAILGWREPVSPRHNLR